MTERKAGWKLQEIDRRKVGTEPLRQIGEYDVPVRLSGDYHPEFRVIVLQEGAPLEVAPAQPAETAETVELAEAPEAMAEAEAEA